jgi:hypothetical protein
LPTLIGLFSVTAAKLTDVGNRRVIKRPEGVLIEGLDAFFEANLDAVRKQIVLSNKILLLNFCVKGGVVFFSNGHAAGCCLLGLQLYVFRCPADTLFGDPSLRIMRCVAKSEADPLFSQLLFGDGRCLGCL